MKNIMGLMKQAQEMQKKMESVQADLDALTIEGSSGAGAVKVRVNGKSKVLSISLDPKYVNADETEILEDLIVAAINDANQKAEETAQKQMEEITKGLPLPPGLKLF